MTLTMWLSFHLPVHCTGVQSQKNKKNVFQLTVDELKHLVHVGDDEERLSKPSGTNVY